MGGNSVSGTVDLEGALTLPDGDGKVPAIVLLHGSGGAGGKNIERWVEVLEDWGIATLAVDSFTPRGIGKTTKNQGKLTSQAMAADAYSALAALAAVDRIDTGRIGAMGFSKGGIAIHYMAMQQVRDSFAPAGFRFGVLIAFYPGCEVQFQNPRPTGTPLLFLLGESDTWTPAGKCETYAQRIGDAGGNVTVKTYDGAPHGFDFPKMKIRTIDAPNTSNCEWLVRDNGVTYDNKLGKTLSSRSDLTESYANCVTRGVSFGGNDAALQASTRDLKAFLDTYWLN